MRYGNIDILKAPDTIEKILKVLSIFERIDEVDLSHIPKLKIHGCEEKWIREYKQTNKKKKTGINMHISLSDEIYHENRISEFTNYEMELLNLRSRIVFAQKKHKSVRICVDYRKLNQKQIPIIVYENSW